MPFIRLSLVFIFYILLAVCPTPAAAPSPSPAREDEKMLRAAGISLKDSSLPTYLRRRTLTATNRARLHQAIPRLGNDAYKIREQASRDLLALGSAALAHLRAALDDPDEEIKERLRALIGALQKDSKPDLSAAVVRLLRTRKTEGDVPALLAYLPDADNEAVTEEVVATLAVRGVREGKVMPALSEALKDTEASRRGAAAVVLGRSGSAAQRDALQSLLRDSDPLVRFRAAQGLLAARDRRAVPALIALLSEGPPELAIRADELLSCVADKRAPRVVPGSDAVARRRCRAVWANWWRLNARLDLTRAEVDLPAFNISLRCRKIARRFAAAFIARDVKTVEKLSEMPFLGCGGSVLNQMAELEGQMNGPLALVPASLTANPLSSPWATRTLDDSFRKVSAVEQAFLARFRKGEIHVFELMLQPRNAGAKIESVIVLVRVTGEQMRVVGFDSSCFVSTELGSTW